MRPPKVHQSLDLLKNLHKMLKTPIRTTSRASPLRGKTNERRANVPGLPNPPTDQDALSETDRPSTQVHHFWGPKTTWPGRTCSCHYTSNLPHMESEMGSAIRHHNTADLDEQRKQATHDHP